MMKYIVFEVPNMPDTPVIFPSFIKHVNISMALRQEGWLPISAGFITVSSGEPHVHGKSESLELSVGEHDINYIKRMFNG